jgi:hypothetical protein
MRKMADPLLCVKVAKHVTNPTPRLFGGSKIARQWVLALAR